MYQEAHDGEQYGEITMMNLASELSMILKAVVYLEAEDSEECGGDHLVEPAKKRRHLCLAETKRA